MTNRRPLTSTIVIVAFTATAWASPSNFIFGTYTRLSRVCGGGPGFADSTSPSVCDAVFEDRLQVSASSRGPELLGGSTAPEQPQTKGEVDVDLSFHFGYSDYCRFKGPASWTKAGLVLDLNRARIRAGHKPVGDCRLMVKFRDGMAEVVEFGGTCSSHLCTESATLQGITYKRQQSTK